MPLQQSVRNGRFALHGLHERAKMEIGQRRRRIVTKIILVGLIIAAMISGGSKKPDGTPRNNPGKTLNSKLRSKTFWGAATAMADQWG